MITNSIIRYLLNDTLSLSDYMCSKAPSFKDVSRRLLLLLRSEGKSVPDHYYRLNQSYFLDGIDSISDLLTKGLYRLADEHLEIINDRIYVKQHMQNSWQELITYVPPLILQMALLNINRPLRVHACVSDLREYCLSNIYPNVRYTALPHPYIPEIIHLTTRQNGFHDLHIHLNGSTETDIVWQDLIAHSEKVIQLHNNYITKSSLALEQIEQDFATVTSLKLEQLLLVARRIRQYLYKTLFETHGHYNKKTDDQSVLNVTNSSELISYLVNGCETLSNSVDNPFTTLILGSQTIDDTPLNIEGLMYILVLSYLVENPKENVAVAFHLYLLIQGFFNRLLVQQRHDYGFEEFQKYTSNGIRENCEQRDYKRRFLQLCGNDGRNIAFVEGRFSPKLSQQENEQFIHNIIQGWESCCCDLKNMFNREHHEMPSLKLIAHFIKKRDDGSTLIRHENLRREVWQRASVLALMKENGSPNGKYIMGIDAAASEFDASPEVFAPAFRYLKRKGFKHFTYHAGEDFFHIIGGLRSIYEAVDFLNLSYGDRIGHATAAGLSPKQWIESVGDCIYMHKGEYLDDLVFAYHIITKYPNDKLKHIINNLIVKIHELSYSIYGHAYSIEVIREAWGLRRLCPFHVFAKSNEEIQHMALYNQDEWYDVTHKLNISDRESTNECIQHPSTEDQRLILLQQYHSRCFRKRYDEIIRVETTEIFSESDIEELQRMVLRYLNDKEIIIETLPTSNVRIGHHHTYDSYHLWNWIRWESEGHPIPPIVVGTDDPGIFATNIYNEYSNIYCKLVYTHHMSRNQAMRVIEQLVKNSQIYRFYEEYDNINNHDNYGLVNHKLYSISNPTDK